MSDLPNLILTTDTSRKMYKMVTPIYDRSYVGLWMIEIIGREYNELWEIVDTFPAQLAPETATWALELWEQRYGIATDDTIPIEKRRSAIAIMRSVPRPLTPYTLKARLTDMTGRAVEINEHISNYTFGVYLVSTDSVQTANTKAILDYIGKHKQAHMSFEFAFQTNERVKVSVSTDYWAISYPMAGISNAGELPDVTTIGRQNAENVRVDSDDRGYVFAYRVAGVYPEINLIGRDESPDICASTSGDGYVYNCNVCGTSECGANDV